MNKLWLFIKYFRNPLDLFVFLQIHKYDLEYDLRLVTCMYTGIKSVVEDKYNIKIMFNNGTFAELWNANKYYAWLTGVHGKFIYPNGNLIRLKDQSRPSLYHAYLLRSQISKFRKGLPTGHIPKKPPYVELITVPSGYHPLEEIF
jgi:hypothetical protein